MTERIYLEVEENENCPYMPMMVYEARRSPVSITRVLVSEFDKPHGVYEVTGWSSKDGGTPCPAKYAPVSDSGEGIVHLVFGGDWGVRMKPIDSEEGWDVNRPAQFGEPYLMLIDGADIILE